MKKICSFILIFVIIISVTNIVCASYRVDPDDFEPSYKTNLSEVNSFAGKLLGIVRNIAAVSLVVIIGFIGLKTMFGSIEERADYKKAIMPLLIGTGIVLLSSTLVGILWDSASTSDSNCSHSTISKCTGRCQTCGGYFPDMNEGHDIDVKGRCSVCGRVPNCDHSELNICSGICEKCNEQVQSKTEHIYGSNENGTYDLKCIKCGAEANCKHGNINLCTGKCTLCLKQIIKEPTHDFIQGVAGTMVCSRCGIIGDN